MRERRANAAPASLGVQVSIARIHYSLRDVVHKIYDYHSADSGDGEKQEVLELNKAQSYLLWLTYHKMHKA